MPSENLVMSIDSRARLSARQSELMQALTSQRTIPGFDRDRLAITSLTLIQKRERTVAHACPSIASALGSSYSNLFNDYANSHVIPSGGPGFDARQFIHHLAERDLLPDQLWKVCRDGWKRHQNWCVILRKLIRSYRADIRRDTGPI